MASLRKIMGDAESRNIFCFLSLNFSFMIVQMLYGFWTNSLGLISDSIHMLFDCLALAIGLFAAVVSKWPATRDHPLGFARIEPISGFINGISLVFVSVSIVSEAIERLTEPPEMKTDQLLLVSSLGLLVNLVGIMVFNHGHGCAHSSSHSHSHSHSHAHTHIHNHEHDCKHVQDDVQTPLRSHDQTFITSSPERNTKLSLENEQGSRVENLIDSLRYILYILLSFSGCTNLMGMNELSYLPKSKRSKFEGSGSDTNDSVQVRSVQKTEVPSQHTDSHNAEPSHNMHGVFLHVLADTLGSVGVILSTILYQYTGWPGFDPLASIFIAVLIFFSVVPLIWSTSKDLLAMITDDTARKLRVVLHEINQLPEVQDIPHIHFRQNKDRVKLYGHLTITTRTTDAVDHVRAAAHRKLENAFAHSEGVHINAIALH